MRRAVLIILILLLPSSIFAQTDLDDLLAPVDFLEQSSQESTSSGQYILEIQQINNTHKAAQSPQFSTQELDSFTTYGVIIRRFDYEQQPAGIHLTIDATYKPFEVLPGKRIDIKPAHIKVTTSDDTGYKLVGVLQNELQTASGQILPPTVCDDGCTTRLATTWEQSDSYGWGYTHDTTSYQPLIPQVFVSFAKADMTTTPESTQLGFRIYPPPDQPLGTYSTNVQIIALPW